MLGRYRRSGQRSAAGEVDRKKQQPTLAGGVDRLYVEGDEVVVLGWASEEKVQIVIGEHEAEPAERQPRDDVHRALGGKTPLVDHPGYEVRLPRRAVAGKKSVHVQLRRPDGTAAIDFDVKVRSVDDPATDSLPILFHVDVAVRAENGHAVLVGWAAQADRFEFELHHGEARLEVASVVYNRQDVASHLENGGHRITDSRHGFVITLAAPSDSLRLTLRTKTRGRATSVDVVLNPVKRDAVFSTLFGSVGQPSPQNVGDYKRLFRPWMAAPVQRSEPGHRVVSYGPAPAADSNPRLSFIIPFYREWSYVLDHLLCQALEGTDQFEWIFVCDDPSIELEMSNYLALRGNQVKRPTKAVFLSRNSGYSAANNAGLRHASGDYIFLLNSDAIFTSTEPIHRALRRLDEDGEAGLVGFTLLYEDGTLQHDGITFLPLDYFGGQRVCEHVGKGLPPRRDQLEPRIREVEAVTGAAMLLRRPTEPKVLDDAFGAGDFEDADLCLKVASEGKKILLVQNDVFFHLERQSMRHIGSDSGRMGMTFMNCIRFNERWFGKEGPTGRRLHHGLEMAGRGEG